MECYTVATLDNIGAKQTVITDRVHKKDREQINVTLGISKVNSLCERQRELRCETVDLAIGSRVRAERSGSHERLSSRDRKSRSRN